MYFIIHCWIWTASSAKTDRVKNNFSGWKNCLARENNIQNQIFQELFLIFLNSIPNTIFRVVRMTTLRTVARPRSGRRAAGARGRGPSSPPRLSSSRNLPATNRMKRLGFMKLVASNRNIHYTTMHYASVAHLIILSVRVPKMEKVQPFTKKKSRCW